MKLALIFLSTFAAISHQQYYRNPRMMVAFPWLAIPYSNRPAFYNDYETVNNDAYSVENSGNILKIEEEEEFADIQSRIKGISRYRPSFQDQQNARFLFSLFASNTGAFNNPLLKTATFTSTQTLTLAKIVSCVPTNQFDVAAPPTCRRKRSSEKDADNEDQFPIIPSETLGVMPTALSSSHQDDSLSKFVSSSKDETVDKMSTSAKRNKRFFINKNQFVVSSTLTTFAFVNTTVTVTVNLVKPPPTAAGLCAPPTPGTTNNGGCATCLPAGWILCPAAG